MKKFVLAILGTLMSASAFAEEAAAPAATAAAAGGSTGMIALAAAVAISIAVLGGTIGQGLAASAALEGVSRNPAATDKIFTPFILSLALIESLVILAFLVSFVKIGGLL
ncbi:MAG: ATP synthase F0 subunit C [Bdellovibrionota bacterium]